MTNSNNRDDALQTLSESFKCPKCRGDQGHARQVRLSSAKLSTLFHREPGEFAFVTCSLCGYTEIYDLAVCAKATAEESKAAKASVEVTSTPGA